MIDSERVSAVLRGELLTAQRNRPQRFIRPKRLTCTHSHPGVTMKCVRIFFNPRNLLALISIPEIRAKRIRVNPASFAYRVFCNGGMTKRQRIAVLTDDNVPIII
jgi:hypothetical protein